MALWKNRVPSQVPDQEGFSKQNTFPRYRTGQSRVSTKGPLLTTRANERRTHSNFRILKFRVLLISYTRLFTKFYFTLHFYKENFQIYGSSFVKHIM